MYLYVCIMLVLSYIKDLSTISAMRVGSDIRVSCAYTKFYYIMLQNSLKYFWENKCVR